MDKIISKDEIDALLNIPGSEEQAASGPDDPRKGADRRAASAESAPGQEEQRRGDRRAAGKGFMVYNFRRPDRVPKAVLHSLQLLHDRFCTNVAATLSIYLGASTEVSILALDQTNFGDFLLTLPDPTYLSAISMRPLNGLAAMEIGLELVFPLIDRLLGGVGQAPDASWKITEIEKSVIQGVVKVITANLTEAWIPITEINFNLQASETRPQLFRIISPNEVVIALTFEMKVGETRGNMHLCIPYSSMEPIIGKFEQETNILQKAAIDSDSTRVLRNLLRAPFEITSELPPTMVSVRDLLSIGKDDVIRLDTKVGDSIQLHVGGRRAFKAEALGMNGYKAAGVIRRIED